MLELAQQYYMVAAVLSVLLLSTAVLLFAVGYSALAITRMLQMCIATNVTLARELSAIQQSLARGGVNPTVPVSEPVGSSFPSAMPSSAPASPGGKKPRKQEGEWYAYDESMQSDLETIRKLRQEKGKDQGGLTDEELDSQIASVKAAGFDENET